MLQLFFFASAVAVLALGHIDLWFFLVKFLGIGASSGRFILAVVLAFLFFSFIFVFWLIHKIDRRFTRAYYFLAVSWLGLLLHFYLAWLLVALLRWGGRSFNFIFPDCFSKIAFFAGVILWSAYGFFNAFRTRVKKYTVAIMDLPPAWRGKTVVQISDLHLGPIYRRHFLARLLERVAALKPAALFITGDLFDGLDSDFSWLNHPFNSLNLPQGIYYCFGNHELYLGFKRAQELISGNPITLLDNKMAIVDGLQIIGLNYAFNRDFSATEEVLRQVGYNPKRPSLLMNHEPIHVKQAKDIGIGLQLSGHTHRGQLFPLNFLTKLAYRGYDYGLFKKGDFNLVVSSGVGSWGPPLRTSGRSEIVAIRLEGK